MFVDLKQGSPEWLEWRKTGLGASCAATIMGENPFSSKQRLWQERTGRAESFKGNAASRRGQLLEPHARMLYNMTTDSDMVPACYQCDDLDFILASLDGISKDGKKNLEIKCSGDKVHSKVIESNKPPAYYYAQMQQGMLCSGAVSCDYMTYNPDHEKTIHIINVPRDDEYIDRLVVELIVFCGCVLSNTPPASATSDYIHIDDQGFYELAEQYLELSAVRKVADAHARLAKSNEDVIKKQLLEFTDGGNSRGGGLLLKHVVLKGNIDYEKLKKDLDVTDEKLDSLRKPDISYWKITEEKE